MAGLTQIMASLAPQAQVSWDDYTGPQYRWKALVFRPEVLRLDALFLAAALLYAGVYFVGKAANARRARAWADAHAPLYAAQFSHTTTLTADGASDFFTFATGRRAVRTLHTVFRLRPRHDVAQLAYQLVWGAVDLKFRPEDVVELDFALDEKASAAVPDCVFAVVAKDQLSTIKDDRWDLTFTKTTDNAALPPTLSVMAEFADITETIFKPVGAFSLPKLLSDPAIQPYFRSLSLSDQPSARPHKAPKAAHKRLVLALALPPGDGAATRALIAGLFALVDALAGHTPGATGRPLLGGLRPETRTKLRRTRDELVRELKADAEKDAKEEEKERKEAAKRKADEEKLANMSAAEQKKVLERERKRTLRKSQGKTSVRK